MSQIQLFQIVSIRNEFFILNYMAFIKMEREKRKIY